MSNVYCLAFGCTQSGDWKCFYRDPFFRNSLGYYGCTPNPYNNCQGLYPVYLCPSDLCWYDICNPDLNAYTCYENRNYYWYAPVRDDTYVLQRIEQAEPGSGKYHLSILPIPVCETTPTVFETKTDGSTWWLEYNGVRDFIPLGDIGYFDGANHYAACCICEYLIDQGRLTRGCALYSSTACYVCSTIPAYALNFSCYTSCIDYNANDCPTVVPTYMTVSSSGRPEEKPTVSLSYKDKQVWSYGYNGNAKCYCNFPMDTSPVCFGGTPVDTLRYNNTNNILHKGTISSGTRLDVSGTNCCAKWDGEVTYSSNTYCINNPACGYSNTRSYASVNIPQTCYRCDCCFCKTCITEYNLKVCGVELVPQIQTYAPDYYYAIPECESSLAIPVNSTQLNECFAFYGRYSYVACIDKDKVNGFLDNLIDQFVASVPSCFNQASYNYDKLYSLSISLPFGATCNCPIDCCLPISSCQQRLVIPVTPDRELIKTLASINCNWTDCGTYCMFSHCCYCAPLESMCGRSNIFCCCVTTAESCIHNAISNFTYSHTHACASELLDIVTDCLKRFNLSIFRGYPTCVDVYSLANPICMLGYCGQAIYQCVDACIPYFTNGTVNLIGNNLCDGCGCVCCMIVRDAPGPAGTPYASKCCWTVTYCNGYNGMCCLTPIGTVDFSCPYNKLSCMDNGGELAAFKCTVDESTYCSMARKLFCNSQYMHQFNTCSMAVVPSEERTLAGQIFMKSTSSGNYPYNYDQLMAYFQSKFDNLSNTCASPHTNAICNAYELSCTYICYTPTICYHGLLPVPQFSVGLYKGCY